MPLDEVVGEVHAGADAVAAVVLAGGLDPLEVESVGEGAGMGRRRERPRPKGR